MRWGSRARESHICQLAPKLLVDLSGTETPRRPSQESISVLLLRCCPITRVHFEWQESLFSLRTHVPAPLCQILLNCLLGYPPTERGSSCVFGWYRRRSREGLVTIVH